MRKNILITGGAGFIGSNFIPYFLENNKDYKLINLDALTYAGNLDNLSELTRENNNERYEFIQGDILDVELLKDLFEKYQFTDIIHFAAESHVDNSIKNPDIFIKTNVLGTFNLLEIAKRLWMSAPFQYKDQFKYSRFHHISTDEVYGTLDKEGLFTETTPYSPNSPYSASKASSDMIVRSYFHTFGMNIIITNCSNNYGPKQHDEKLIPTIIRKAINGENIPIYGNGNNIRDWLYVLDHCKGIELAFKNGINGESYNIGGKNERANIDIAKTICNILDEIKPKEKGKYEEQIIFTEDRPGHDFRYAIDATKIEKELGWKAEDDFESAINKTIKWYLSKYQN